ncbi:MAG TPA: MaoC/PaaZ C-terminal domain-containing protein [Ramlibacter sp.]|uniref:MaoC/PaaZ C-terminal domain-containing protein n=1 Tax=Ramlibacter sp. TaxID=1917967 RepID=UPI002C091C3F|nr:MaoC/PaaZ C-terminal domain-containing protein [Ramlibacter sp.]HVZ42649.1 MaoC/PaaZ C-terminal domain-containing protein [Ramlibacter sp.]
MIAIVEERPPRVVKGPLELEQLRLYAEASGDFNDVHLNMESARRAGVENVFAHGMLTMSFAAQVATQWLGPASVRRIAVRFLAPVRLGDTIVCDGRVVRETVSSDGRGRQRDIEVTASNGRGELVLSGVIAAASDE